MSDNELDEELLALAGGESDVEPDAEPEAQKSRSASRASSPRQTTELAPPQSPPRRGVAQRKMARSVKKSAANKRRKDDSDEEEGEASSAASSPNSLGSGAMSESESDASPGDAEDNDVLFPIEGKYKSEKDRAEIMAMSEIQREEILAERAAEVERRTQDLQLRRLLQAQEAKAADKKKRKAGAADLDDSQRKSSRPKTKANESLESYKRQREQRNQQRRRDNDRRNRDRRSRSRDSARSDADADGESEVEWDEGSKAAPAREEKAIELRDIELVRVGRSNFARVCNYPGFVEAITGCFCRVSVGVNRATGENVYRMAQIKGFTETGKPYTMEGPNRKPYMTDQYATLAHGKAEKDWPFLVCSDSKFTEAEFERYRKAMAHDNLRLPSKTFLAAKLQGIHDLLNRQWTDKELEEKIKRQNRFADQIKPALLNGPNANAGAGVAKPPNKALTQQERLAALNRANRKANAEEIRRAQIAEKRAEAAARAAAAARAQKAEQEAAAAAAAKEAASLQVPLKSNLDDLFDGSDLSRAGTPMGEKKGARAESGTATPVNGVGVKTERKGIPTFRKRNMDDDLIGAMDLGIDIDI